MSPLSPWLVSPPTATVKLVVLSSIEMLTIQFHHIHKNICQDTSMLHYSCHATIDLRLNSIVKADATKGHKKVEKAVVSVKVTEEKES